MGVARQVTVGSIVSLALLGCWAGDGTGVAPPDPCSPALDPQASLSCDVQPILTANCALSGCHAGATPAVGMNLSAGTTFANTVNVSAVEVARLLRVRPGDPDSSFVVLKIEGNGGVVGGVATRMPLGLAPLAQAEIDTIRSWINSGALDN